jgi:phage FluMu gp28-like protein
VVAIGVDLAKERDETVITVTEIIDEDGQVKKIVRYVHSMHSSYDTQFKFLQNLILKVKPNRVSIDATGVGQMFVERARAEIQDTNIEAVSFTNAKKERWATSLKGDMQLGLVQYPTIPDLMRQIHGIRRTKTESGFYKFSGTHDDYFWSLILSCYGEGRVPARISFVGS